ncbi:BTB/POZ and MATH domain-containing protein 3-like [Papaver somniferum]|uniref:BTB/POZ and MATH domain-containing protein 3-like n=1 Tax=Papaver somniferum TaxID=3469 RepID=UPI000E6F9D88|nr:BTB/POZ and MATH domain-containing protein 3-like [Papaver somniferum]
MAELFGLEDAAKKAEISGLILFLVSSVISSANASSTVDRGSNVLFKFVTLSKIDLCVPFGKKVSCFFYDFKVGSFLSVFCEIVFAGHFSAPSIRVVKTRDGTLQTIDDTVQTRAEEEKDYVIPVLPSDMIQNLKGLLDSEIGFDVTFHVGNEFFGSHKLILAGGSPVFKAQFFGLVGNTNMETISIEEFEPFAFKVMLLFLYSDELPESHELSVSDSPCTSTTILQHLLVAADRFDLPRLRLMCEAKLSKPENLGGVMKSEGYAYLEKWYPSLLTDLLETGVLVDKK